MKFSRYNRDRPFLVAKYFKMAPKKAPSHKKDYGKTGQWQIGEDVSIEDSIKNCHMIEAAVIIDILKGSIIKNNLDETNEEVLQYFIKKYTSEIQKGIRRWMFKKDIMITPEQIKKIEDNIDRPNIIMSTLVEGASSATVMPITKETPKHSGRSKKVSVE